MRSIGQRAPTLPIASICTPRHNEHTACLGAPAAGVLEVCSCSSAKLPSPGGAYAMHRESAASAKQAVLDFFVGGEALHFLPNSERHPPAPIDPQER